MPSALEYPPNTKGLTKADKKFYVTDPSLKKYPLLIKLNTVFSSFTSFDNESGKKFGEKDGFPSISFTFETDNEKVTCVGRDTCPCCPCWTGKVTVQNI